MRKIIELGETLRLYSLYTDIQTGEPTNPTSVVAAVKQPDGSTFVVQAGNIINVAIGEYFVRFVPTLIGTHSYRITAVLGTDTDIRTGKFDVEPNL